MFYEQNKVLVYQVDTGDFKLPDDEQQAEILKIGNNGLTPVYFVLEQQFFVHNTGKMQQTTVYLRLGDNPETIRLKRYIPEHYPLNRVDVVLCAKGKCLWLDLEVEKTPSGDLKIKTYDHNTRSDNPA